MMASFFGAPLSLPNVQESMNTDYAHTISDPNNMKKNEKYFRSNLVML